MRAAAIEAFGGPGALLIHSLPVPVPAAGEVLIATNTAVGARIRRFSVGDAVYAAGFPNPLEGGGHQRWGWSSGFYAECVAVSADGVAHLPKGLDLEHAGAMMPGLTALQGIDALALRLGADMAVDGHREDLAEDARRFAQGGVDAVLALAGGPALTRCLEALRPDGRLAYPNGAVEPAPKTRRVVHGAWEANLFISNVLDKQQPESGWPRGTDPCRDAHHSPGDLGEGNGDQIFHPRGSR